MFRRSLFNTTSLYGSVLRAPDDGAGGAGSGDGADKSGAGGAAAGAAAGAAVGASDGKGAAGGDDAAKAAAAETARVAALTPEQKTAEAKAATDKVAADKTAADKAAADAAKPIDYSGVKIPEAWKADDATWLDAQGILKELGVKPDGAQKLIDFTAERDKLVMKGVNDANQAAWTKMRGEWKAETEKTVSVEDRGIAKQAAEKLFDKKTAEMLEASGYTDHPGFIQAMVKIGKAIKDDTLVTGNAAVNGAGSDARAHFPKSNMNP